MRSAAGAVEPPAGPTPEAGSARQRILDAARTLFCARGYERTPLREISDSLNVSKAAIYYHFRAKEELLVAIVGPVLDRIDEMIDAAPTLGSPKRRRDFLGAYVNELTSNAGVVDLLLRDPGVGAHSVGQRFDAQHVRMRQMLGAGDDPSTVIRTTTALRALELAVIEFGGAHPDHVRTTALDIAIDVLDSRPMRRAPV